MAGHYKTLVLQLLGDIARGRARDLNPGLGEEGAGNQHESDVYSRVNGVKESLLEVEGRGHVVSDTRSSVKLGRAIAGFPNTKESDEEVVGETRVQHLANEEDVGAQSGLKHDRHVGGVEEADGVRSTHAALAGGLDGDLHAETLEVDDGREDQKGGQEVHDVGKVLAVEGLPQGTLLVLPRQQEMEESDNGSLELGTTAGVDGRGREGLPDDGLADVRRDEQRDSATKTIALLQQLIQQNDNQTRNDQLHDQQNADTSTEVAGLAVETGKDIDTGLAKGQDDREQLLGGLVQFAVGLQVEVDVDEVGSSKELRKQLAHYLPHPV